MLKKLLSFFLVITMGLSILSVTAFSEDDILDYLEYEIVDSEVVITGYNYSTSEFGNHIDIPSEIEGYPVTTIGLNYFGWVDSLTSVTIPDSVVIISDSAKSIWASILGSINVGANNQYYCSDEGVLFNKEQTELVIYPGRRTETTYIIPDSVSIIGDYAFNYCESLTDITIPDSVTAIGVNAFENCASLTSITIPASVTTIGRRAFCGCSSLSDIKILGSVTSLGFSVFTGTSHYNNDENWYNGVYYIDDLLVEAKHNITECIVKEGVKVISAYAFHDCYYLEKIVLPSTVSVIGECAFMQCSSLKKVECNGKITMIGEQAFNSCISLDEITGIEYVEKVGTGAFINCPSLNGKLVFKNNEVELDVLSVGASLFDFIADVKTIVEHLMLYNHGVEGYSYGMKCDEECYNMYAEKQIIWPDNPDISEEELYFDVANQLKDDYTIYGYRGSTAEVYADTYGFKFVPICEHINTDTINILDADCENDGYTGDVYCYDCEEVIETGKKIASSGHKYVDAVITAPSYTHPGEGGMVCENCGDVKSTYEIPCLENDDSPSDNPPGITESLSFIDKVIAFFIKIIDFFKNIKWFT